MIDKNLNTLHGKKTRFMNNNILFVIFIECIKLLSIDIELQTSYLNC